MPLSPCAKEPFVGTQQFEIPFGSTVSKLTRVAKIGGAEWVLNICRRSALPIYGVKLNANGLFEFIPSSVAHAFTLVEIARSCFDASANFVNDTAGFNQYTSGEYGDYLYRKLSGTTCLMYRYEEAFNKAYQFLSLSGIAAYNFATYKELTYLSEKIMKETDKSLYLPPGVFLFDIGSSANTALEAWFAADNTLAGLYSIETVTT